MKAARLRRCMTHRDLGGGGVCAAGRIGSAEPGVLLAGIGERSETIARSGAAVQAATCARPVRRMPGSGTGAKRRRSR